jgi:hypothetical protein
MEKIELAEKKRTLGCGGILLGLILLGIIINVVSPDSNDEVPESVSPTTTQSLSDKYLNEIDSVAPGYFVNNSAALSYLKQYCEADQLGDAGTTDAIDQIAKQYCSSELARELGVETSRPNVEVDISKFLEIAEKEYGVVTETFDDGSTLTPQGLALSICKGNLSTMKSNLGSSWDTSFQKFAIETFCPEKLGN